MDVSLPRLSSRILLVAVAVACAGLLGWAAGKNWLAAYWAATKNPADWERAVRLEPDNATYWNQLGLYQQWDFANGDINAAIRDFRRATEIDPSSARQWMALAGAYEAAGNPASAHRAYLQAQSADPVSAEVEWRFGSFLLRQGDIQQAAGKIRQALVAEPELTGSAISQFWKSGADIGLLLGDVLPPRQDVYLNAIGYFLSMKETDAALSCWQKLAGLGQTVPLRRSLDLIDSLIDQGRLEDAARTWRQALAVSGHPGTGASGSLIFNGGFEEDFLNGGFGWRESPAPGTAFDVVNDVAHGSRQSARVVFDGSENVDYGNLAQFVPITPGDSYRFTAWMRTDAISTDSGLQFVLLKWPGPSQQALAETPVLTGTHPWTHVQADFTAGADLRCVLVVLRRKPSSMFDNKISGTVWVDDVRLEVLAASREQRP